MLVAEPARVPPGGTVTLVIHNRRDERLGYGLAYTLERWDGHAWTAVPTQGWEEPALAVEPGSVSAQGGRGGATWRWSSIQPGGPLSQPHAVASRRVGTVAEHVEAHESLVVGAVGGAGRRCAARLP